MHSRSASIVAISVLFLSLMVGRPAQAQTEIALKNGETIEVGDIYFIGLNCKSLLTATPAVEIMDGPPGVAVAINQAMVVPRYHGCAKPVSGGKMFMTAKDVDDYSYTRMVLRITYKTKSGNLQRSEHVNVTLFP